MPWKDNFVYKQMDTQASINVFKKRLTLLVAPSMSAGASSNFTGLGDKAQIRRFEATVVVIEINLTRGVLQDAA